MLADSLTDFRRRSSARATTRAPACSPGKARASARVELVTGTKLKDVALRKKLYEGGAAALKDFSDPMLDLARAIDPGRARRAQAVRGAGRSRKQQAYAQIAKARFALEGASNYPDATFTLRLSYGTVEGYEEVGKHVPAYTDFGGLYQRSAEHENQPPSTCPSGGSTREGQARI